MRYHLPLPPHARAQPATAVYCTMVAKGWGAVLVARCPHTLISSRFARDGFALTSTRAPFPPVRHFVVQEFDMDSILKAEAEMLASIGTATGPSLASVAAVRSAPGVRATSSLARAAAARLLAEAEDDDEDDEDYEDDEDMDGDEDDEEGDDDDEDEEDDMEEEDDEEEEEAAPAPVRKGGKAAPAAGKNVRFSGVPAPAAVKSGKGGKAAPAAAAAGGAGGNYNFGKWFKK